MNGVSNRQSIGLNVLNTFWFTWNVSQFNYRTWHWIWASPNAKYMSEMDQMNDGIVVENTAIRGSTWQLNSHKFGDCHLSHNVIWCRLTFSETVLINCFLIGCFYDWFQRDPQFYGITQKNEAWINFIHKSIWHEMFVNMSHQHLSKSCLIDHLTIEIWR